MKQKQEYNIFNLYLCQYCTFLFIYDKVNDDICASFSCVTNIVAFFKLIKLTNII